MKAVITIIIIALVVYGGWELWVYWNTFDKRNPGQEQSAPQAGADQLPPLSYELENSLAAAQKAGPAAFRNWLKLYGPSIQDPRRAAIELDYIMMIAREDPNEAKRIFADVKGRTPETSPVYKRVKQLEKTYE